MAVPPKEAVSDGHALPVQIGDWLVDDVPGRDRTFRLLSPPAVACRGLPRLIRRGRIVRDGFFAHLHGDCSAARSSRRSDRPAGCADRLLARIWCIQSPDG